MTVALVIAGGKGARMGMNIPKQFVQVNGKPILFYTLEAFQRHPMIDAIELVLIDGWQDMVSAYAKKIRGLKAQVDRDGWRDWTRIHTERSL